ncbi:MAG TPA: phospholipid carrier-dependent glycosyltransferase [Candidatus Dormibacteraeota bacterium]|nr:phospholipid carrier-dependent glycosyltransferase [Candidatus Dormibacteraeota bacterium]
MAFLLPAALCIVSGYLIVALGWRRRAFVLSDALLRVSLSVGYGLGIFSVSFFLARVFGLSHLVGVDVSVLALLIAAQLLLRGRNRVTDSLSSTTESFDLPPWLRGVAAAGFAIALCAALYSAVLRAIARPHGEGWDAYAIWNLHARFLFVGGDHWRDGFSTLIPWSHPDYPLLLPAAVAHFWSYLGHEAPAVPAIIGLAFTLSTLGLLFTSLDLTRGRMSAMLGGLALVSTPFFIEQGTSQYADVPLSFFFLAAIVLLFLHGDRSSSDDPAPRRGLLVLAGLAAGFAAWTKNEGLLFLFAVVVAQLPATIRRKSQAESGEEPAGRWIALAVLFLAMTPALVLIAWFKHSWAPAGELFSSPPEMLHWILTPGRYWTILQWYAKEFLRFGHWFLVPGTLLLAVLCFLTIAGPGRVKGRRLGPALWTLAFTLAGYFFIYVITPYDLHWHLRFSLNRLFLQLWPCAIFLFFLHLGPKNRAIVSK